MVRVRYAPSPTGSPHVGNIRTALFNFLMAKRHGGVFVVRIEDTDQVRKVDGALEDILESLEWLGIRYDEGPVIGGKYGPYFQSERTEIYREHCQKLIDSGKAYKCFCTPEELDQMREYQRINKLPQMYDRRWRNKSAAEVTQMEEAGVPYVVRLAMPLEGKIEFFDAIRGRVEYESALVDDQVLLKSDGWPTYHLANVVDDYLQGVTHVIRGDEWISSTPKHVFLYQSFGWTVPIFAHAPIIKGPDGSKLSKRHGDTRCLDYREKGYLPEAVANFIALIGWSPGEDKEILSMQEMASCFSIEGIQPSPGVFDLQKLQWMNGHYIRQLTKTELYDRINAFDASSTDEEYLNLPSKPVLRNAIDTMPRDYVEQAFFLEQERVKLLSEFADACDFFFVDQPTLDIQARDKWFSQAHTKAVYSYLLDALNGKESLTLEDCESLVGDCAASLSLEKKAMAIHPIRVALTGRTFGPGLYELMNLLGPERMRKRLEFAIALM